MTLRGRLALINVGVLLIALLLLAGIVLNQLVGDLYEQLDHDLALIGTRELAMVKVVKGSPTFGNNGQPLPQIGLDGFIRLVDTQGQIVDGVGAYRDTPVSPQTFDAPPQGLVFNQTSRTGLPLRVHTRPVLANNRVVGFLQVANEREEVEETLQVVRRSLIFGIPLVLLISGLISLLTARQALRPLTRMTQSAAAISAQDLSARLPVPRAKDEVQALAFTFNATLDRLAAAFARQRRFTADASHELRTPVTAILGQAELALSHPRDPNAYQATLSRIQQEAERMQRLIGRMLTLARVETGRQPLTVAPTDVARLVHTLVDTVQPQAEAKELTLKVNLPETLIIATDADSLTQILLNLLENAITYTDEGEIELALTTTADQLCLTVSDTGPGIPPDHLPYIFQPFYRVDPSRSQGRGSVGLGLALTHELTNLLGGHLEVSSKPPAGTTFTLTLPLENKKSSM
jgi:heavy metal sensor kinase